MKTRKYVAGFALCIIIGILVVNFIIHFWPNGNKSQDYKPKEDYSECEVLQTTENGTTIIEIDGNPSQPISTVGYLVSYDCSEPYCLIDMNGKRYEYPEGGNSEDTKNKGMSIVSSSMSEIRFATLNGKKAKIKIIFEGMIILRCNQDSKTDRVINNDTETLETLKAMGKMN
jgi:hypothetical protein